jgi:hypothetical protein
MTPQDVAIEIEGKIDELVRARDKLKSYAENKARTMVAYEREMAKTIVGLKAGRTYFIEEEAVSCEQATNIKDVAKGVCWKESLEASKSEMLYKNCVVQIEAIKSELNGWQSYNKYLDVKA